MGHTDGALKDVPDERYPRPCAGKGTIQVHLTHECPTCQGKGHLPDPQARNAAVGGGEFAGATFPAIWAFMATRTAMKLEANGLATVTDCRFTRDLQATKNVGGVIIRTHRKAEGLTVDAAKHQSEIERSTV